MQKNFGLDYRGRSHHGPWHLEAGRNEGAPGEMSSLLQRWKEPERSVPMITASDHTGLEKGPWES